MDERLKILLIWGAFIALVIGLRLLVDYVLVIYPPPQVVTVTTLNSSVFSVGHIP